MKTIEIENAVFQALEKKVVGFGDTPNDVIKRLLSEGDASGDVAQLSLKPRPDNGSKIEVKAHPLVALVESPEYRRGNGKRQYFDILRFLYASNTEEFAKLDNYRKGNRVQISKSKEIIENNGSRTMPQKLDSTPYWVLTNLSHARKRDILGDVLQILRYPNDVIAFVLNSIPDSGISRRRPRAYA